MDNAIRFKNAALGKPESSAVWCWGDPIGFDDGGTSVPADLPPTSAIVSGYQFNCALLVDGGVGGVGGVRCWVLVSSGDIRIIAGVPNAVQLAAGGTHACALINDGSVTCWGNSIEGRAAALVPQDLEPARFVAAGARHTCILATSGATRCWGSATFPHSEL